ncbi:MAG: HAD hydrolase-like protein [Candidatus Dependentiae bacterium]|nr:HAD hydrolase-like protein [Candidatus Dependentiae bacterium]
MNCRSKTIAILFFLFISTDLNAVPQDKNIKHIFIDINTILTINKTAASKIVGIINSMKYTAKMGHIPSKTDFFKSLKNVPAITEEQTYNDDLIMPVILCDWLLGLQTNHMIRSTIFQYLEKSSLSEIEKTIFKNVSSMMMSPSIFIETQYLIKEFSKLFHSLKKAGYTLYLIGNWDKESEPYLMRLLSGHSFPDSNHCYFSNKAKNLKPNPDYFDKLLKYYNLSKKECLIIDIEKNHAYSARNQGFNTILLHDFSPAQLKSELTRIGIQI